MEISFNTSRIPDPAANQPVARPSDASSAQDNASTADTGFLKNSLQQISLVRPEKVDQARALVSDAKYPPTEVLDGIAHLLALHLKP